MNALPPGYTIYNVENVRECNYKVYEKEDVEHLKKEGWSWTLPSIIGKSRENEREQ